MPTDKTHEKLTPAEERALKEEASFGDKPGNQTPNTPEVKESERPYEKGVERHRRVWGRIPGNQTADTPDVNEREHGKR